MSLQIRSIVQVCVSCTANPQHAHRLGSYLAELWKNRFQIFGFRSHPSASWTDLWSALSDLGARVIKVEPPDGDLTRLLVPRVDWTVAILHPVQRRERMHFD